MDAIIEPSRNMDVGLGPGQKLEAKIMGGVGGVILDGRGRPLQLPEDVDDRMKLLRIWFDSVNMYEREKIEKLYD